jgi:PAS domain S-box-containing protein
LFLFLLLSTSCATIDPSAAPGLRLPISHEGNKMKDQNKTKKQLINELTELRQRVDELEALEKELRQTGETLRENEGQLELITDSLPVLISYIDPEQRYRFNNKAYEHWFGHLREEVYGKHIKEVLGELAYEVIREYVETALSGQEVSFERWAPYKNGGTRYISATYIPHLSDQGQVKGFFALVDDLTEHKGKDEELERYRQSLEKLIEERTAKLMIANMELQQEITERKRMEEVLKKSIKLLNDTGEMAKVGGWELDLSTKEVLLTEELYRIHGLEPGYNLKLEEALDFYAPESRPDVEAVVKKAAETGEPYDLESLFIPRGSKDKIWVRSLGRAVYSGDKIVKLTGTFQNIDKYKRVEAERERLLADLEAKNRELEAFVYTISHDLKAPLVSLNGFSSALQKEFNSQLGEEGRHYVERIQANVAHMEALITSLLELSRIGRVIGPTDEIDVGSLLREIRDELTVSLKEARAEFVVQEVLPIVRADRGRIHQVFVNLIDNAVKFRSAERALRIEVGCQQESGFYRFHVADNGIGIAPQYHEQIFTPFRKLHPEIEGVGIGLALVKKIVEHHGGRVWVESEAGEGSVFYFTIPRG